MDQLRQIVARLDVVEIPQRRGLHLDYVSDDEVVAPKPNLEPEEDWDEVRLLRVLTRDNAKPIVEVTPYDGKLDINAMLDWISNIGKFFDYENTPDNRMVKIVVTKLKGHASLR